MILGCMTDTYSYTNIFWGAYACRHSHPSLISLKSIFCSGKNAWWQTKAYSVAVCYSQRRQTKTMTRGVNDVDMDESRHVRVTHYIHDALSDILSATRCNTLQHTAIAIYCHTFRQIIVPICHRLLLFPASFTSISFTLSRCLYPFQFPLYIHSAEKSFFFLPTTASFFPCTFYRWWWLFLLLWKHFSILVVRSICWNSAGFEVIYFVFLGASFPLTLLPFLLPCSLPFGHATDPKTPKWWHYLDQRIFSKSILCWNTILAIYISSSFWNVPGKRLVQIENYNNEKMYFLGKMTRISTLSCRLASLVWKEKNSNNCEQGKFSEQYFQQSTQVRLTYQVCVHRHMHRHRPTRTTYTRSVYLSVFVGRIQTVTHAFL